MFFRSLYEGADVNLIFIQYVLGLTFNRFQSQTDGPFECIEACLAVPPPPSSDRHAQFFGCPVTYGGTESWVALTPETWTRPLVRSEPKLQMILEQHATMLLSQVRTDATDFASLRDVIRRQLVEGPPTVETAAKALAVSGRTLQRRLQEAGTTFQGLIDEERAATARVYLTDPQLGTSEVAYMLGYSESSAFARAFRRWTGQTPSEFRARLAS